MTPRRPERGDGVRPGAGGEEAALFAALLLRMYQRYAERKGLKFGARGLPTRSWGA